MRHVDINLIITGREEAAGRWQIKPTCCDCIATCDSSVVVSNSNREEEEEELRTENCNLPTERKAVGSDALAGGNPICLDDDDDDDEDGDISEGIFKN